MPKVYSYNINNVKFLNLLYNYIKLNINILPTEFFIIKDTNINITFNEILSNEQETYLNLLILNYLPDQKYEEIYRTQTLNIKNDNISTTAYKTISIFIYNNDSFLDDVKLSYLQIGSYLNGSNSYQIRLYDVTNQTNIYESEYITNQTLDIITLSPLINLPNTISIFELQGRVIDKKDDCIFDVIQLVYTKTIGDI